ncbi:acyl-CoA dehydrogenase family protein [Streptomyces sp. SBR177]
MLGLRTSPTGALHLDDVFLPEEAVLGRPGEGLATLYDIISFDRALYGLVAAAYLEPRLDAVLRFSREREAFGAPILDHQYVQGRITDIRITIETARAVSSPASTPSSPATPRPPCAAPSPSSSAPKAWSRPPRT